MDYSAMHSPSEKARLMDIKAQQEKQVADMQAKKEAQPDQEKVLTAVEKAEQLKKSELKTQLNVVTQLYSGLMEKKIMADEQVESLTGGKGKGSYTLARIASKFEKLAPETYKTLIKGVTGEEKPLDKITLPEAQAMEVILAMSPILSGSKRVLSGVLDMLRVTVPKGDLPISYFRELVGQSMDNMYKISKAYQRENITEDELMGLSDDKQLAFLRRAFWGETLSDEEQKMLGRAKSRAFYPREFGVDSNKYVAQSPEEARKMYAEGNEAIGESFQNLKVKISGMSEAKKARIQEMINRGEA